MANRNLEKQIDELLRKLDLNITLQREILSVLKKAIYEVQEYVKDPLFEGIDNSDAKVVLKFLIEYAEANGTDNIPLKAIVEGTGLSRRRVINAIRYLNDKGFSISVVKAGELERVRGESTKRTEKKKKPKQ